MRLLLFGLLVAVIIFVGTNGHVLLLPLLLLTPLAFGLGRGGRRTRTDEPFLS